MNLFGSQRKPFLFISNFDASKIEVFPLEMLQKFDIEYTIQRNYHYKPHPHTLEKEPISYDNYQKKFHQIISQIKKGNTYLLNLTQPTKIKTNLTLKQIYQIANANYKLRYQDKFVCFSPEAFLKIKNNTINTFPMKGTIDASLPNAKEQILLNKKELAEHVMVVDLLRNDLSMVATNVRVKKFRYITNIDAGEKKLLQVSSHIQGNLEKNWHNHIGTIIKTLLPAGSITGTPKKSTVDIIKDVEEYERDFFTGVFGVYDGETLDSGVMIRFIENTPDGILYKSGGGITLDSDPLQEYQELLNKVYLP